MNNAFDQIAVLIPAYEPSVSLIELISELNTLGFTKVFVINDGSKDEAIFNKISLARTAMVLTHKSNLGKGAALKTGIRHIALQSSPEIRTILTVDADGQHLSSDVERIARKSIEHPNCLILGVRDFSKTVPIRSLLGNIITRLVLAQAANIKVKDTQTGLRAMPLHLGIESLKIAKDRYEFELEAIILSNSLSIPILEVPISTIYLSGNESSHFKPLVDSMRIYAIFSRYLLVSFLSFIIDITIFYIIYSWSHDIFQSTYFARIISATINFISNKFLVFRSHDILRAIKEILGYATLVFIIAFLSAVLVQASYGILQEKLIAIKIIVDSLLFFASFAIQRFIIFKIGRSQH